MSPVWQMFMTAAGGFLAASSGFWLYLKNRAEARNRENDSTIRLLMGLAQTKIVHLGLQYIDRGYVTKDEYRDLRHYLYEPYIALGGNGTVERIMHGVERLEFRSSNPLSDIPIRGTDRAPIERRDPQSRHVPFKGKERRRSYGPDSTREITDEDLKRGNND